MPRFPTFLTLNEELCSEILKTRFCTCSKKFHLKGENGKWNFEGKRTGILRKVGPETWKVSGNVTLFYVFLRLALRFQRLFMFSAQLLIKYVHQLPEKLISQIRRWGKISSTSKEDFDLSGFSEIRCRIWWFLYPKITFFLRICLKTKGHRSPEIPLKFIFSQTPISHDLFWGTCGGPKKSKITESQESQRGQKGRKGWFSG